MRWTKGCAPAASSRVRNVFIVVFASAALSDWVQAAGPGIPSFREHVVNPQAGTGLAVTVSDINSDGRPDIVGVSSRDVAWYENPNWERHLVADTLKGSNVCIAGRDLDGDGREEFVLGADWQFNNTKSGGALYVLKSGPDPTQPWRVRSLIEEEPTLHRIRWTDVTGDGRPELVVAPLKGRDTIAPNFQERGVRLFLLYPPADPMNGEWREEVIDESLHLVHNIWPVRAAGGDRDRILAASFEGITEFSRNHDGTWRKQLLVSGNPRPLPESGAGEIKHTVSPRPMLATIEPWHGHQAVVYVRHEVEWSRHVIDDGLAEGHAVWWADFDAEGEDELLIGFRGNAGPRLAPGLNVYKFQHDSGGGLTWSKHVIDDGGMAAEDALAADMNGDGLPDIVAYGRATTNIKYYENLGPSDPQAPGLR